MEVTAQGGLTNWCLAGGEGIREQGTGNRDGWGRRLFAKEKYHTDMSMPSPGAFSQISICKKSFSPEAKNHRPGEGGPEGVG